MADDPIRTILDLDLSEESKETFSSDIQDIFQSAVKDSKITKQLSKLFSSKNIKGTFLKNITGVFVDSEKRQKKQLDLAKKFKSQQADIVGLIGKQGKGFKGSGKLVGMIFKQAGTGIAGMASKIDKVIAAVVIAMEIIKKTVDQLKKIAKESAKFVGQGSIFTDKATMGMMQKTGQTATQAQGTQRSLDMLGLDFSDIQSGKLTAEQADLFEQLRLRELDKLEKINEIAGPMMKSLQQITLGISLLAQDIQDWITMAFAAGPGIEAFIVSVKNMLANLGPMMRGLIKMIVPIADILMSAVSIIMNLLIAAMPIVTYITDILNPFLDLIMNFVGMIARIINPVVGFIGAIIALILKLASSLNLLAPILDIVGKLFDWIGKVVGKAFDWLGGVVGAMAGLLNSAIGALKSIDILGWKPFGDLKEIDVSGLTGIASGQQYSSEINNNYIYGSNEKDTAQKQNANIDLFSNQYALVND